MDSTRQGDFKRVGDEKTGLRRREDQRVTLREKARVEALQKKRMGMGGQASAPSSEGQEVHISPEMSSSLDSFAKMILSDDPSAALVGTTEVRKLLSIAGGAPITRVIQLGLVPRFISFLRTEPQVEGLRLNAAWSLTNIASGTADHTRFVVDQGAIPEFIKLLSVPEEDVREQAVWALGNIAGDSSNLRDMVLAAGAMGPVLINLSTFDKVTLKRNATWCLSNLVRGKPSADLEQVKQALPMLAHLLWNEDLEVRQDATWAVSYISDGEKPYVDAILQANVLPRLVEMLGSSGATAHTPALRTLGNIVSGNDEQTQMVINSGALNYIPHILKEGKKPIKKEAIWMISNIAAGSEDQIQSLINAKIFPMLVQNLSASELEVRREAAWALSNATTGGTPEQLSYIVDQGAIQTLCEAIHSNDYRIVRVALETIDNILTVGEELKERHGGKNIWSQLVSDFGGLDRVESLQCHSDTEIYTSAQEILMKFFETDEANCADIAGLPGQSDEMQTTGPTEFKFT